MPVSTSEVASVGGENGGDTPPGTLVYQTELTAAAQNIDITGLDGNTHRRYKIKGYGPTQGGAAFCNLTFNGVAVTPQTLEQTNAGAVAATASGVMATFTGATGFEIIADVKSGQLRGGIVRGWAMTTTDRVQYLGSYRWGIDTSSNITSMRIAGGAANCFMAGFRVRVDIEDL